jgi:hypothetical protein
MVAHGFEYLCQHHDVEILCGRYRLGTYELRSNLGSLYDRVKEGKPVFPKTVAPDDIVQTMQIELN